VVGLGSLCQAAEVIDINGATPVVTATASMA